MKVKRKKTPAIVPAMAMGDIAFNLLIFFVILARATDDSHLQWEPASAQEVKQTGYTRVSVLIDNENKYYVNGEHVGIAQLPSQIAELLAEAPEDERTVFLKVHRESTAYHFEPVIEAISETGGKLVHVLEKEQ